MAKKSVKKAKRAGLKSARISRKHNFPMDPLPATFTLISMLGLIVTTVFTISGRAPLSWGVAFDLVFALMFLASMITITPRNL